MSRLADISRQAGWLLVLIPALLQAAEKPAAGTGEIIVRARSATIQQSQGVAEYVGNAELIQGARHLRAERILVYLKDNRPQRVEASGEPVTLTEGDSLQARARRLVYDMGAQRIWLYEQAHVEHEGRVFEGGELEYRLDTRQVNARSTGEDDRVKLVIPAPEAGQKESAK